MNINLLTLAGLCREWPQTADSPFYSLSSKWRILHHDGIKVEGEGKTSKCLAVETYQYLATAMATNLARTAHQHLSDISQLPPASYLTWLPSVQPLACTWPVQQDAGPVQQYALCSNILTLCSNMLAVQPCWTYAATALSKLAKRRKSKRRKN